MYDTFSTSLPHSQQLQNIPDIRYFLQYTHFIPKISDVWYFPKYNAQYQPNILVRYFSNILATFATLHNMYKYTRRMVLFTDILTSYPKYRTYGTFPFENIMLSTNHTYWTYGSFPTSLLHSRHCTTCTKYTGHMVLFTIYSLHTQIPDIWYFLQNTHHQPNIPDYGTF